MEKNKEKLKFDSKKLGMDDGVGIQAEYDEILQQQCGSMDSFICKGNESKVDFSKSSVLQQNDLLPFDEQGDIISRKTIQKREQVNHTDSGQIVVGSDSYLPGRTYDEESFDTSKNMTINDESNNSASKKYLFSLDMKMGGLIDVNAVEVFHPVMKDNLSPNGEDSQEKNVDFSHIAEENKIHSTELDALEANESKFIDGAPDMQSRISLQNRQFLHAKLLNLSTITENVIRKHSMPTSLPQGINNEKYNIYEETIAAPFDAGKNEDVKEVPDFSSENLHNSSEGFQFKKLEPTNCASYKKLSDLNHIPTLKELASYVHLYGDITEVEKVDPLHRSDSTSKLDISSVNYDGNLWWKPVGKALEKNNKHENDIAEDTSEKNFCKDNEKTIVWDPDESDLILNCHELEMKGNNKTPYRWTCYETSGETEMNHEDYFSVHNKNSCTMPRRCFEEMRRHTVGKKSAALSNILGENSFVDEASKNNQVLVGGIPRQRIRSNVELDFDEITHDKGLRAIGRAKENYAKSTPNIQLTETPEEFSKYQSPFQSVSASISKLSTQECNPSLESSSSQSYSRWNCETPGLTVMDIIKHQLYFQAEGLSDWLKQFLPPEYYTSDNTSKYPFRLEKLLDEESHVDQMKDKVMNQQTSDWSIEVSGQNNHEGCFEYKYHPWSLGTDENREKKNSVFSESAGNKENSSELNLEKVTQVKYTRDYLLKLSTCILAYAFPEALHPFAKNMELPLKQLPYPEEPQSQPEVTFLPNVSYQNGMDHILFYQNVNYTSHLRRTENKSPN